MTAVTSARAPRPKLTIAAPKAAPVVIPSAPTPYPLRDLVRAAHHSRGQRATEAAKKEWEQAVRQRWRALALVIKAKLEAIASEISTFDDEFLANIVLPDGSVTGDWMRPQVAEVYRTGTMPALLPMLPPPETPT